MVESVLIEAHAINVRGIPGTSYKSKLSEKKFDRLLDKQRKKMEKEKQKVYKHANKLAKFYKKMYGEDLEIEDNFCTYTYERKMCGII